jgi:hypothetical protein
VNCGLYVGGDAVYSGGCASPYEMGVLYPLLKYYVLKEAGSSETTRRHIPDHVC